MNILDHVKSKLQRDQRLSEAQLAHLRSRAYRGVAVEPKRTAPMVIRIIEGKRYECTPVD